MRSAESGLFNVSGFHSLFSWLRLPSVLATTTFLRGASHPHPSPAKSLVTVSFASLGT